jgi:glycosyltransferase involved in cell wall biosynthesis
MPNKRILFYSSVKDPKLFDLTGFYIEDLKALRLAGFNVKATNNPLKFLLFWNFDIGFFYFYKKSFLPAFITFLTFKKVVFTGGIDELSSSVNISSKNKFVFKVLFILNYLISDTCNIVSFEDLKNTSELLKSIGINQLQKLIYFPHSIDVKIFCLDSQIPKEDIICTICWMDNISNVQRKGVDVTIRIFKKILENNNNFKLYIIGSWGAGKDYLDLIVNELNISNSVIFTGAIGELDKVNLLNRSKFYFQLSKYEGFGIAVIEAMALNNYIIHSGKGGLNDTVGENGYLVNDFNNVDDLVDDILSISTNFSNINLQLIQNSLKVHDLFSTKTRADNFKSIINNV